MIDDLKELKIAEGLLIIVFLFFLILDLINSAVGNNADKEKKLALTLLHNVIGAKKKGGVWTKAYEQVMKRHLELCVDLKDHRMAKDGLHQYRNLCQLVRILNLCCISQF